MELFEKDSVADLFLRGFTREWILANKQMDIGRNGRAIGKLTDGIDRTAYRTAFVQHNVDKAVFVGLLSDYGAGLIDLSEVFGRLGLYPGIVMSLSKLAGNCGLSAEYAAARKSLYDVTLCKSRKTMMQRYGVAYSFQSDMLAKKARDTMKTRYGVAYSWQSAELYAKMQRTMIERYGSSSTLLCPEIRAKMMSTMEERYGVSWSKQSSELRDKAAQTMRDRFGVNYTLQSADLARRVNNTKRLNGTFNRSQPEDALYDRLVCRFGVRDVVRQYCSDEYPFECDFYVKSRNLYIELNAFWLHGNHWFDGSSDADLERLSCIVDKAKQGKSMYENSIFVWTVSDVEKRAVACEHGLNYVVFWSTTLDDADLWFAMGCPDGRDWYRMYSWLPERELAYDGDWPEALKPQGRSIPAAARMANWREFYKRELALWDLNYDNKWGTVQARLYANRFKYIGKLPDELTNREILRGLNIAGMVRAYSHFDNSGMVEFLRDYDIKSLYDPCAGWGERMLTSIVSGVEYTGTDINPASVDAHMLLLDKYREYASGRAYVALGDSAERDMTQARHEAVFTCPPYGDREIYTAAGAENLDSDAFLDWWRRVVEHSVSSTTRAFAYQIDQVWKDRMNAVVESLGWRLDRQIPVGRNRVSHMTRSRGDGTKHNFEEVQVFVR